MARIIVIALSVVGISSIPMMALASGGEESPAKPEESTDLRVESDALDREGEGEYRGEDSAEIANGDLVEEMPAGEGDRADDLRAYSPSITADSGPEAEELEQTASLHFVPVIFAGINASEDLLVTAAGIEAMLVTRIEERGRVEVIRKWDLGRLLENESERLVAGCIDDCGALIELLDPLGAPLLLVGELHVVGGKHLLTLTLLDTQTAGVRARVAHEAGTERRLLKGLGDQSWNLVRQARLERAELGPSGMGLPRFHLALKAGNSLASIGSVLVSGRLLGGGLNIEASYYATPSVLIFLEMGAGVGRVRDKDTDGVLDIDIVPAGFGIKRLWTYTKVRLWAGGSLGAGFLGLFLGGSNDLATALATTMVIGADYRLGPRWAFLVEGSTSLTDALLNPERYEDVSMPIFASLTLGVAWLFP